MRLGAVYARSKGYPVDDPDLMLAIIAHDVPRSCSTHGVRPVGTLILQRLDTATINGRPLFDDDDVAVRWELEVEA